MIVAEVFAADETALSLTVPPAVTESVWLIPFAVTEVALPPMQLPTPAVSVQGTLHFCKVIEADDKVKATLATSIVPVLFTLNISL